MTWPSFPHHADTNDPNRALCSRAAGLLLVSEVSESSSMGGRAFSFHALLLWAGWDYGSELSHSLCFTLVLERFRFSNWQQYMTGPP